MYGIFSDFCGWALALSIFAFLTLGYLGASLWVWSLFFALILVGFGAPSWALLSFLSLALIWNMRALRSRLISPWIMQVLKNFVPKISETERVALEAGVVWIEANLFSGRPNYKTLNKEIYPSLTEEEKRFIEGPVEKLCQMIDDWKIWSEREIPKEIWDFLKKEKFFGMIIPKKYGGLEFSALAHSEVISKIASRSLPVTITTMVPNSLGPAELLVHYGTEEQKNYYLPRLARGEEIPAFALTEPGAGSDAGSIQSSAELFKGEDGKLYIRLQWNKRYITLAAVSTLLGMAFRLRDPKNLLGKGEEVGITCALIPTKTQGVVIGKRHDPNFVPFYNCPTHGSDVILPVDAIIGGIGGAGRGWEMLMECLGAGRGISLPAQSAGGGKMIARLVSAHASVRKQFGMSLGSFEGIEEPLSRIGTFNYILEAMRLVTLGALDKGIKPPVVTAIAKYQSTELARKMVNDAMDIMGGSAISRGPRNPISSCYVSAPISVTVEGANILTRTLMIFGQGALRAHPFAYKVAKSAEKQDLAGFDQAFWGHVGHVICNTIRALVMSITRGRVYFAHPGGKARRYYQKLAWVSASFSVMADIAMATLGGALKMKEKITGRYADILSWLYIGTAVLRRWEAEGRRKEDWPLVQSAMNHALSEIQVAFNGIFANLRAPLMSWVFTHGMATWNQINSLIGSQKDELSHEVCKIYLRDGEQRDRLTQGIYLPKGTHDSWGRHENAFRLVEKASEIERRIRKAIRKKELPKKRVTDLLEEAVSKKIISSQEKGVLAEAEIARNDAIQVDEYTQEQYLGIKTGPRS